MSKVSVSPITNGQNLSAINQNFSTLANALNDGALWRQNPPVEPNQMLNDLDMNGKNVLNVGLIDAQDFTIAGSSFDEGVIETVEAAAAVAVNAAAQATAAASQATTVVAGALQANNNLSDVQSISTAKLNLNLVKADVGLGNVDNTSDMNKPVSTAQQTALNLKADLASPTFTGDPKAPTPATADNDTSIATTAFVQTQFQAGNQSPTFGGSVNSRGAAATNRGVNLYTNTTARWSIVANSNAESGSNAGSDLVVTRYNDAGTGIDSPLIITRSTGAVQIKGASNGSAITTSYIGEYVTNSTSGFTVNSGSAANMNAVSLTAGEWDIQGVVNVIPAATTVLQKIQLGVSTASATMAGLGSFVLVGWNMTNAGNPNVATPVVRLRFSTTTTVYIVILPTFTTSTCTADGFFRATRVA